MPVLAETPRPALSHAAFRTDSPLGRTGSYPQNIS